MPSRTVMLKIKDNRVFPFVPMIATALKSNYKHVIICSDNLPLKIVDYLKNELAIEVQATDDCLNYDYAVEIKNVERENIKFEYKNTAAYIYISKPDLTVDDVNLLKLRNVDIFELGLAGINVPIYKQEHKILHSDFWFKHVNELNTIWAKLLKIAISSSVLEITSFINKDEALQVLWRKIQDSVNLEQIVVNDVSEFMNAIVLVGLSNVMHSKKLQLILDDRKSLTCIPLINKKEGIRCRQVDLLEVTVNAKTGDSYLMKEGKHQDKPDNQVQEQLDGSKVLQDNSEGSAHQQGDLILQGQIKQVVPSENPNSGKVYKEQLNVTSHTGNKESTDVPRTENASGLNGQPGAEDKKEVGRLRSSEEENGNGQGKPGNGDENSDEPSVPSIDVEAWAKRIEEMLEQ